LGIKLEQLIFLGYPDFKTLNIWYSHWQDSPAAESMLTKARAVPYANAFRPGAPYKGEEILQDLEAILREFKPTKIFVSHPGDHNPDHRALYLFARVAIWDLENEIRPAVYPYLIHYKLWPEPKGYHPDRQLVPPEEFKQENAWFIDNLEPEQLKNKFSAIKKHRSQYISSGGYLASFMRRNELFGDFPSMTLSKNTTSTLLSLHPKPSLLELPEQLFYNERVSFIGIEQRTINIEGDKLVLTIKLSRPLGKQVGASIYMFGYRHDRPFKEMPKIHIKFGEFEYKIYDQDERLSETGIKVVRKAKEITVYMPLDKLGNPQHILTSAHTYLLGTVPLDWVSWRILEISDEK
jgi:LmbE family N-acetylglucosaminyl deacetylase